MGDYAHSFRRRHDVNPSEKFQNCPYIVSFESELKSPIGSFEAKKLTGAL